MKDQFRMALIALFVPIVLAACQAREEQKPPAITSGILNIGPASNYRAGSASGRFLVSHGIYITNSSGDPIAIRPRCGAKIALWEESHHEFVCPDDGIRYDIIGRPLDAPGKKPLPALRAEKLPDGTLTVDLTKLYGM